MHDLPLYMAFKLELSEGETLLELSLLMRDVPGALASVTKRIAEIGGDIKWGITHESGEEGKAWWCTFLVIREGDVDRLIEALRKEENVIDLHYTVHGRKDVFCSLHHNKLSVLGDRALILRTGWMKRSFLLLKKHWGEETLKALLYLIGEDVGRGACRDHRAYLGRDPEEKDLDLCLCLMRSLGWISHGSWYREGDRFFFVIKDPFESITMGSVSFLRGVLAGYISELTKRRCKCHEVNVEDDVHEFVVEPLFDEEAQL